MQLYQPTITGSLSVSGSINLSGSITLAGGGTISGTASIATNAITASSADNFLVRNTLTAQTLVVQTITSSVDFVTGSTRFGSIAANTHVFTGSVLISSGSSIGFNTSPAYPIDVYSSVSSSLNIQAQFFNDNFGLGVRNFIRVRNNVSVGATMSSYFGQGQDGKLYIISNDPSRNDLVIDGTNGNVGIGTNSPLSKFQVNTGTNQNFRVRPGTDVGATNGIALNSRTDDDSALQQLTLRASDIIMLPSGNVGIGTSIPLSNLQINGNNSTVYDSTVDSGQDDGGVTTTIRNNDTSTVGSFSQINMMVSGDSGRALGRIVTIRMASATSDMAFVTENANTKAERMRITAAGRVGIENSAPQGKLEVGRTASNTTAGGHFFSTFIVPVNTWTTVFYAPNNNWNAITEFTWTSGGDYNRSGAAYMRWAYNAGSASLGVVYTLFNNSQNADASFRNSGGEIQVYITGGAASYNVQVRIQGSQAA